MGAERFSARVTSLRKLRWDSMKVNFFVVTPPAVLEGFPASFISAFRLEPEAQPVVSELAARFPNITVIDAAAAVRQAQGVIDQLINAVQFVFLFALAAGLLVLYSALVATEDERRREAAVMRVYGASRAQVTGTQRAEFLAMGVIAGVLATLGAAAIGQVLARRVFELDLPPSARAVDRRPARRPRAALAQRLALVAQGAARFPGVDATRFGLAAVEKLYSCPARLRQGFVYTGKNFLARNVLFGKQQT